MKQKLVRKTLYFLAGAFWALMMGAAYADAPSNVSDLVTAIQSSILIPILNIVTAVSYLAGAGFIVAAIFKFKAHKDNPTQVTVGTPVMLLFVGVALLFFPAIVGEVMNSIGFGTSSGGSLTYQGGGYIAKGSS